ncbi:MAG: hypothetical protein NC328_02725 [Muribaculum sp.]|nr:hypothetical protein [Muribaculum sp.]
MKKLLLALAALFAISLSASAQTLYVSYGGYTQMDACDNHDHWGGVNTAWGALNAGIDFNIGSKLKIGPSYTFSSASTDGKYCSHVAYHAVLLNVKYDYWKRGIWTLYGHGGVGIEISHMQPRGYDSYNKCYFAGQISPLGARVGLSKNFKAFAEVGFGAQGVVQLGFSLDL